MNENNANNSAFTYDPDADVLAWEMNEKPIVYAREIKNVIIHFSHNHSPVLVEVLDATQFLARAKDITSIIKELGISLPAVTPAP